MRSPEGLIDHGVPFRQEVTGQLASRCGILRRHPAPEKQARLGHWSGGTLTLNDFASSLTRQLHPTQFVISLDNKYWKQQINYCVQA